MKVGLVFVMKHAESDGESHFKKNPTATYFFTRQKRDPSLPFSKFAARPGGCAPVLPSGGGFPWPFKAREKKAFIDVHVEVGVDLVLVDGASSAGSKLVADFFHCEFSLF